ncbi:MAG: dihydrolipoyl dehydrogenase [Planctomycetes bacterium]|nr:dihydrolipoyl dehydrogenase [Planctomycetota bacterium]
MSPCNIAIIGGGPGGYVAAIRAAQLGAKVCVIEKDALGGTCLNRGCIPTKALWECARLIDDVRRAADFGIRASEPELDFAKAMQRTRTVIETLTKGIGLLLKKNKVDVIEGVGCLRDENTIGVGDRTIHADKIILATGSRPAKIRAFPYDGKKVITSDEALRLSSLPKSILIVGGGYIGAEFASFLHAFGAKVTVVEALDRLLPLQDADVSKEIFKAFKKQKIGVHTKTKVEELSTTDSGVSAKLASGKSVDAEVALISVGREPYTEGLGLENVGLKTTDKGTIEIDETCRTALPGIYAIGDITPAPQLAHVASAQAKVAAANAAGQRARIDCRVIPACIFVHPEAACVGLTEQQAKDQGIDVKCATFHYRGLGRAIAGGEIDGMFKLIGDPTTGELLGAHIVGAHASDMIGELALAMKLESTIEEIAETIHAHPTLAEGIMETAEVWLDRPVHT